MRAFALEELEGWKKDVRDALASAAPELPFDAIHDETRAQLEAMLPSIPDPGAMAPQMRAFTTGGAIYVAYYLSLHARGWDAARVWSVLEVATKLHFERMSSFQKRLASDGMFSWPMKALSRWLAKKSHVAPVGGWIFSFVEGDGEHDYGVTYEKCAIRDLAIAHGAADFAPYICLSDIQGSHAFGWGLTRSGTLAQGASACDFRFKRNGETRVRVKLPVVPG
ncbi:MAG: L-2-amino-thiazoline-4-carboxylic acid hydrolase [Deltaproteobacteria bacterium]|nr:L-2-amino-thiazoline-4-carboxylic acid hydrolase [Deltaproteobacteria bacterium]